MLFEVGKDDDKNQPSSCFASQHEKGGVPGVEWPTHGVLFTEQEVTQ